MSWRNEQFLSMLKCPVLVVGAGGIGCELLKNLALTGFCNIEIIDLDIIDVSNLNRQFLFRRQHVGQPKSVIAAESVKKIAPNINIICHHDSILNEKYNIEFFQQFKIVLSALDNIAARNHINRLCLSARVPLIESGSSRYLGNVRPIIRDETECYECNPQVASKTYPGCTIRNTPSEPIHCIVWAKHLFNQLFGDADDEDQVSPDFTDGGNSNANGGEIGNSNFINFANENSSSEQLNQISEKTDSMSNGNGIENGMERILVNTKQWAVSHNFDPKILFQKFFNQDIKYLLTMSNLWKKRQKPYPAQWDNLPNETACSSRGSPNSELWTVFECREEFQKSLSVLRDQVKGGAVLTWDKDDDSAMRFVAACANIRAYVFNIPLKTLFDIKSMAGNIIPAIATTNAIVAGLIVVEALKIILHLGSLQNVFLCQTPNPRGQILVTEAPNKPNAKCYVCSERREISLKINIKCMTVNTLELKFLKGILHMVAPDVMTSGKVIISSEEGETDAIRHRTLESVGVTNACLLECDDFMQNLELRIFIHHCDDFKNDEFVVSRDTESFLQKEADDDSIAAKKRRLSSSEFKAESVSGTVE